MGCLIPRPGMARSLSDAPRRAVGRRGDVVRVKPFWRTRWRMKPRASQPQNRSPCPRVSARSVLTGRRARTGRAAEDVGPYHRSAPARSVLTDRRARTGRAAEDVGPYHRSAPTRDVRTAPTRPGARWIRAGRLEAWGCRACKTLLADEVADEAVRQPASTPSPCPRAAARSVLTGRRPRTGRAAEDVGPYHRSAPARSVLTDRRARTGRAAEDVGPYHRSAPTRPGARWTRAGSSKNLKLKTCN